MAGLVTKINTINTGVGYRPEEFRLPDSTTFRAIAVTIEQDKDVRFPEVVKVEGISVEFIRHDYIRQVMIL
jgi:hypothetical protein